MKDPNCAYCMQGDMAAAFAYPVCEMNTSFLYIFKEQSKRGRCVIAHKKHVSELIDLTAEERTAFFSDVAAAANAIHKAFKPDKLNYGAYGDTSSHLHFHLVPKYRDGEEWGGTFEMNSKKTFLSDSEYENLARTLRAYLPAE